jgi:argininosuccinate lyase
MRGGRFSGSLHDGMRDLNASIDFDRRLFAEDIRGSLAWAEALRERGLITAEEARKISEGLRGIEEDIRAGRFGFSRDREDIHMNVEAALVERIGPAGEKLHTGRSRNDQVATDFRLWVKGRAEAAAAEVEGLLRDLVDAAEREVDVVIPAYTHLQRAQPVLLAHHLLAYAEMMVRDRRRFLAARDAADVSPLGSGACAGNQYGIDRDLLRERLGFRDITRNSLDAVSDRDFAADYIYAASMLLVHLSRLAEDLILWSSAEFALVRLDDAVTTGSSMLPQKRNPDSMELARGKVGRVVGDLMALLTVLKGLPLTYNKDLQEDKERAFDAADTVDGLLPVVRVTVATMRVDRARAASLLQGGFLDALGVADYLVRKGVPFREAHRIAGAAVRAAEGKGTDLAGLSAAEYRALSPAFGPDLLDSIRLDRALEDKDVVGGTAPVRVRTEIDRLKREFPAGYRSSHSCEEGAGTGKQGER